MLLRLQCWRNVYKSLCYELLDTELYNFMDNKTHQEIINMWDIMKSIILCRYCRKNRENDNEEKRLLGPKEECLNCGRYQQFKGDLECECDCSSSYQDANTYNLQKNYETTKDSAIISASAIQQGDVLNKMASGDHILDICPCLTKGKYNVVQASPSTSGSIVTANSPLWKQMEQINHVFDSRPPDQR